MAIKNAEGQVFTEELGGTLLARCIDDRTEIKSLATESVQERAVEMGMGFVCTHIVTIGANTNASVQLTTDDTHLITINNLRVTSLGTVPAVVELYEDATITTPGSSTTRIISNINRRSTILPEFTTLNYPTISDIGTNIMTITTDFVAGNPSFQLLSDTNYILKIYNDTNASVNFIIYFQAFQLEI